MVIFMYIYMYKEYGDKGVVNSCHRPPLLNTRSRWFWLFLYVVSRNVFFLSKSDNFEVNSDFSLSSREVICIVGVITNLDITRSETLQQKGCMCYKGVII